MSKGFGLVQPSLIQQIKKILDQYPDDGQILKELIQNAEDANAKEVKFLYDHRLHRNKKLCHPKLTKFQGPALYAYNDAKFTDEDWDGIGMLCDSIKEKDPTKVGRFGLGFKSVFHMTDLPSVISGKSVGIIDPEEKYFSDNDGKRSGRKWHLRKDQRIMKKTSDQFAPYKGVLGCDEDCFEQGKYEGTLFRLPLRQEASQLSETIYSQEKMKGLFECFEKDAHLILLFLMNLERIEVYEREEQCLEPRKLFHVGISDHCLPDVRKAREDFSTKVQENVSALSSGTFPEVKKTYTLTIETVHYNNRVRSKTEHSFVVTLFSSGSDVTQDIKALMTDESLSYLPLVGVALPLQPKMKQEDGREKGVGMDGADDDDEHYEVVNSTGSRIKRREKSSGNKRKRIKTNAYEPKGHLFCFLPLPLEKKSLTGLPVHVNGFFALSQNRRHLKWPSADQDKTLTDKSLLWNKGLLQEVLPKAYAELILHVISCLSEKEPRQTMTTSDAYSAWPDLNTVDEKWKGILQPLFDILLQSEVLYTDANGGGWCKAKDVILDDMEKRDQSRDVVIELLNITGQKVVTVPAHVKTALQQFSIRTLKYVTPNLLRTSLKAHPSRYSNLNHHDKILLLKFVLSDSNFTELEGLALLPLSDKTFTTFGGQEDDPIYIDSAEHPKSLLPGLQRMFLDTELDDAVTKQLKNAVEEDHTQLLHFNKVAVKRHLRQTLPSDWLGSEDHVTWHPGKSNQPTIEWLKALWKYFGRHFARRTSDLDAFVGLPLVPLSPPTQRVKVQLARIQRPSRLVLASFNGESIDESVCHVLKTLGLTILKDLPEYMRYYPGLVPTFANPPSPKGVLNAMCVFINNPKNKEKLIEKSTKLHANDIRNFRKFLSNISQVDSNTKDLLRKLPLFETWVGRSVNQSRFVSLDEVKDAAPTDDELPSVNVFIDLIDLRKPYSNQLASLLGTLPMSKRDLLEKMLDDALNDRYSCEELDEIVQFIFNRFAIFSEEEAAGLREKLKHLPFVALDSETARKRPGKLFDPKVKILSKVFIDEQVFPEGQYYAQPDVLIHLRKLGLKGKDGVTASDICKCAKLVRHKKNVERAKIKSVAILKLLEQFPSLLEQKVKHVPLKNCLDEIPWIPVLMKRPETYPADLPLKESKYGYFACPKDVTSHEFINLVGSVKLMVKTEELSGVSARFGWNEQPSLQDVKIHLESVIKVYKKSRKIDDLETKIAFEKMYAYFQQRLGDERDEIKELLTPLQFILVQKHFLSTNQVAFSSQFNYPLYLCQLPDDYRQRFRQLFKALDVRESFGVQDYIKTLSEIAPKYRKIPIYKEEFKRVTEISNLLADAMEEEEVTAVEAIKKYGTIFLPDSKRMMKPSRDVCVKDCYWMPDEEGIVYANEGISPQVCIILGAKTRRQETLRKHTFGLLFGQKEKLTNRLKRILTGYPCDESIMKELLQNADDAKATKVCFIKDPRRHRDKRVFEECWKPLQGPALCVYNNAPFTKSDIKGIQNLGEGNKGDDPNKTGQYGVGFNAVYHLTDAPTFISQGEEIGEVMCVFDPNLKFAPGADASNPGVMYKELPALRKKFPDVFPCYEHGKFFPLKNATMFRFPLRNKDMATTSKISNKTMTVQKLDDLLNDFKEELLQVLLFVNNVKEISICEIDKKTGKLNESYRVQSSLSSDDEKKRKDFAAHVSKIGKRLRNRKMSVADIPVHQVSYVVNLKDSKGLNQKWFVVQKIGFEHKDNIPDNIEEAFEKGDLGLLPRGGVASLISSSDSHQNLSGKAFCFLPLPFKTGLPVHVNGHFALDHEARRRLWGDEKGSDYRSNWNNALLREVVAPCYVTMLDEVRQHISLSRDADEKTYIKSDKDTGESVLSRYVDLFPSRYVPESYWEAVCKEVYRHINAKALRLLPVLRQENKRKKSNRSVAIVEWLPPTGKGCDQAFFDNLEEVSQDDTEDIGSKRKAKELEKEEILRSSLLALGFNLLYMPIRVYKCFKNSSVDVSLISPTDVISFFQTYNTTNQLCNVGRLLPSDIKDTQFKSTSNLLSVLEFCKKDKNFLQRLEGLPLLLTEDYFLRVFSQSHKVFLSRYYKLLPHCESMFVHHRLLHSVFHFDDDKAEHLPSLVFKRFDVASFASQLPNEMEKSRYTTEENVAWNPDNEKSRIPNKQWINRTWKFFSVHIEKKINDCEKGIFSSLYTQGGRMEGNQSQEKKRLAQEALEPVKDWCLLPAFLPLRQRHVLAPLKLAPTVIYLEGSGSPTLKESLRKIFLPELNYEVMEAESSMAARRIVADLDDPKSVLSALLRKFKTDSQEFKNLQESDCSTFLIYLSDQRSLMDSKCVESLKTLPLYVTIHDDITNISGKKAFVLSSRIPKDDMDIWEETEGIVFLKENKTLDSLYKLLDCHYEDEVDVYCDVIFENFDEMSEEARLKHLVFVEELLAELESENSRPKFSINNVGITMKKKVKLQKLLDALYKLKFMTAKAGTFKTASSFYDPTIKVFAVMLQNHQEMFPPEPFFDVKWLPFLRRIGLIYRVSNEKFLQFAKEVETEAKTRLNEGTKSKSEALVTYLFKSENIATSKLLDDVKEICFIFPDDVDPSLKAIHKRYGSGKTGSPCICFRGSVASKNHSITWTTANLLPRHANPFHCDNVNLTVQKEIIARRLEILRNPSVDMVVNHCKNICSDLCQMNCTENAARKESRKIVGIMTSIYKYLGKNYEGNEEVINELKNIRCIVVDNGRRFVFPNQVSVDITSEQEIRPYLYKIPLEVGSYAEFLKNLGTTNSVTASQYSMVLKNIHDETGDEKLHPNETTNAFKATKGFFETFDKNKVQDTKITPLYLPGVKQNPSDHSFNMVYLKSSANILCNDAPHLKERMRQFNKLILVKLADCGMEVNNEDLLVKKLPDSIRPCMLTSVVHETLMDGDQYVSCSSTAQKLREVLTSSEFCHGMIRLIKHADYESDVETSTDIPVFVQERLRCIRVYSVLNLRTKLVYNGTAIPRSEADVSCFEEEIKQEDEKVWKIYIEKEAKLSMYVSVVATIIDRITGHLLKTMLVHLPILLSSKPYEIKELLDGLKIREDNLVLKSEATCLPTPGNFIHITDHHLLVDDFTVFSPGEYVGYELDDPSLRGEEGTPAYIYAIIIEEVFEDGHSKSTEPSLKKYKIDIGKDKIVVDAADLYKFYRPSQGNSGCLELELSTGRSDEKPRANLDEVQKEVRRILREAWKQPEEKRKKIIKRLFLKWHPDKNPGNEKFCTEVFKFIQQEIQRLEKGEGLVEKSRKRNASEPRRKSDYSYNRSYSSFFKRWSGRARHHKDQKQQQKQKQFPSNESNPQPGEARRWYNQAKADLKAAGNDVDYQRTSYEWACFKCHQSAEKALKAAQYSIDADKTNAHNLRKIAQDLKDDNLNSLASELESLVGDSTRMRYPDRLLYPNIPHGVYTKSMASKATDLASKIVQEVGSKFLN